MTWLADGHEITCLSRKMSSLPSNSSHVPLCGHSPFASVKSTVESVDAPSVPLVSVPLVSVVSVVSLPPLPPLPPPLTSGHCGHLGGPNWLKTLSQSQAVGGGAGISFGPTPQVKVCNRFGIALSGTMGMGTPETPCALSFLRIRVRTCLLLVFCVCVAPLRLSGIPWASRMLCIFDLVLGPFNLACSRTSAEVTCPETRAV
mmetsp:Transcript_14459/g.28877  ORF Transcript_14459/g.28877 Transcript_14459/m.28877 type:complete len:202 (+) Transcript_14459:540-1145(+)